MTHYDVIGDIHGQAGKLEALLKLLGYARTGRTWRPPHGTQAVFLGDLIDRGPEQLRVLEIVRAMVDAGDARCVLGNHELNAIAYMTRSRDRPQETLRPHSAKNEAQHVEFLRQVGMGSATHIHWLRWFRTLPVALDLGGIRAVHAWWHQPHVDRVAARWSADGAAGDGDEFLHAACTKGTAEWQAMEGLIKGLELNLPPPCSFVDHGGVERHEVRTKWWLAGARTYREVAIVDWPQIEGVPDHPLPRDYLGAPVEGSPVFVGHYWMKGSPVLQSPKLACLDWSAAKDGPLVAYRWEGGATLDSQCFFAAGGSTPPLAATK